MSEHKLWEKLRHGMGKRWHASRIESHATAPGFPDVDYCIGHVESHVELKYGSDTNMPEIRASQIRWHNNRAVYGGRSFIFTELIMNGVSYFLLHGGSAAHDLDSYPDFIYWMDTAIKSWTSEVNFNELANILGGKA